MKKRRSLIVAFLLVAVMAIGIGYAAITGAITVNGNLSAQPEGFHIVFTDGCFDGTSAEGATYYFTDGSNGQAQELSGSYTTISVTVENLTSVDQVVKAHLVVYTTFPMGDILPSSPVASQNLIGDTIVLLFHQSRWKTLER